MLDGRDYQSKSRYEEEVGEKMGCGILMRSFATRSCVCGKEINIGYTTTQ